MLYFPDFNHCRQISQSILGFLTIKLLLTYSILVDQAISNRSRFITLTHAEIKSLTNFSRASELP